MLSLARTNCVRDGRVLLFADSKNTTFNCISEWLKTEEEIERLRVKRNKNVTWYNCNSLPSTSYIFGNKRVVPIWVFLGSILILSLEKIAWGTYILCRREF